jgi:hypothetical protein
MTSPTEPRRATPADAGDDEPRVYAVTIENGHPQLDRRTFIELTAVGSVALVAASCSGTEGDDEPTTTTTEASTSTTPSTTSSTTTTSTTTTTVPTPTTVPPEPGTGQTGVVGQVEFETDGRTDTLPCGSPLPPGAVCTCNCVTTPTCSCVGDTGCGCVGDASCAAVTHYWYPN